jgi:CBS domain-containing protein
MTSQVSDQRIAATPAARRAITRARSAATTTTLVEDVMTTRVISVTETTGYKDIVTLLRRHRVSAVPVLDAAGRVTGVVSEADLLIKQAAPPLPPGAVRLAWRLRERSKASASTAAELMTSPAVTVRVDAEVARAARLMRDRNVRRLPVTDADGRLVGIVSRTDVLSVYERPDEQIRDEIAAGVIAGRFLLDPLDFDVTVTYGIVTIAGRVESSAVALSMLAAIRGVEGTVAVRDRLSYPPTARSAG